MKKLFAMVVLMAMSLTALAQHEEGEITIQPRIGITISNITDGDKSKVNLAYGVEFERFFTDQFSASLGVIFTNQGCKWEIERAEVYSAADGTGKKDSDDMKLDIYYGTLPIMANYYILPGLALKAGIQPAFRVKARIEQNGNKIDLDNAIDAMYDGNDNKLNTFDLSIPVGLSYEYAHITVDARYNFGVTKLISNADKGIYNKVFIMTLGYKF